MGQKLIHELNSAETHSTFENNTLSAIVAQLKHLEYWLKMENVFDLRYQEICKLREFIHQKGMNSMVDETVRVLKEKYTNFKRKKQEIFNSKDDKIHDCETKIAEGIHIENSRF